jgi:hypothetical protein
MTSTIPLEIFASLTDTAIGASLIPHNHVTLYSMATIVNLASHISGGNTLRTTLYHQRLTQSYLLSVKSHLRKSSPVMVLEILQLQRQSSTLRS